MAKLDSARELLAGTAVTSRELNAVGIQVNVDGPKRTLLEALVLAGATAERLAQFLPDIAEIDPAILTQVERDSLYRNYINRQQKDVDALQRDEACLIPEGFSYAGLAGLSNELKAKLERVQPRTLAQAGRIEGMTPAALTLLLAHIRRRDQRRA